MLLLHCAVLHQHSAKRPMRVYGEGGGGKRRDESELGGLIAYDNWSKTAGGEKSGDCPSIGPAVSGRQVM